VKTESRLRPKKRLGQHFLVESKTITEIISRARFHAYDVVLEIGPGKGALTMPLARRVAHVVAVEKDTRLTKLLEEKLLRSGVTNVTLVNEDVLKWDFEEVGVPSSRKMQVIGNLPYNISSPFLEKLIENRERVGRAILMFQMEMGKRIAASPATKAYGAMTLLVRYYANPTTLIEVSREAFYPRPKVDSMVLQLDFERPYPRRTAPGELFKKVVKCAFTHRRKTILNSMKAGSADWDLEILRRAMERCGIDPKKRPEALDMDEFMCLSQALALTKGSADANSTDALEGGPPR
jgi:16S rRNA (adenine1518-N6/adenine1519-N6)-dimethyltransferase